MKKRKYRKALVLFMALVMSFQLDIPVSSAQNTQISVKKGDGATEDTGLFTIPSSASAVSNTPTTAPAVSSTPTMVPEVSNTPTTAPAVSYTPASEPTAGNTPTTAPAVSETPGTEPTVTETPPLQAPARIAAIYFSSLGKKRVRIQWPVSARSTMYRVYRKKKGGSSYRMLGVTQENVFLDKTVAYNNTYKYRIIPVAVQGEEVLTGDGKTAVFDNRKIVSSNHQKYSYSEMSSDIKKLAKNYYGMVQYQVIGKSQDSRNIYDVILGNPDAKKTILVVSTLHAREYMASLLCMNQIEYYLQNYEKKIDGKSVKKTLDQIAIHIIPMANPDGVSISQYGISRIRSASLRKTLRKISRGNVKRWKANARGVDLNRNYPYLFQKSGRRGSEGYTGPYAASESETRAVLKLVDQLQQGTKLIGVVNYHATGSIVFGDCRKSGLLRRKTTKMYYLARKTTGYRSAAGYRGSTKLGRGCLREYLMYGRAVPSITLEIGRFSCPLSMREYPSIWRKNKRLILREARLFLS